MRREVVLVVEDQVDMAELLAEVLEAEGFKPLVRSSAAAAVDALKSAHIQAVLLDWALPDSPGIELARRLREEDAIIPILFVTGRNDEASIARALDAGADDYLVKPVRQVELIARLEAHIRKAEALREHSLPAPPEGSSERFGDVEIDLGARIARVAGEDVRLGPLEFKLLEYLARNAGMAVSRDQILSDVYGYDADIPSERVDLVVRRLRHKLGEGPTRGGLIVAVPGYGYRIDRRSADGPVPPLPRTAS